MKPRSMFDYYKYYIYSFKNFKKTLGFPNSSEKTFSGKTSLLFRHFSPTTTFPDNIPFQIGNVLLGAWVIFFFLIFSLWTFEILSHFEE